MKCANSFEKGKPLNISLQENIINNKPRMEYVSMPNTIERNPLPLIFQLN